MRSDYGRLAFEKLGAGANWLLDFAYYGTSFVFGDLGEKNSPRGFYFAFQALPTIIFIAALFAVLYYLGIMQLVVKAAARVMTSLMGASGAESLNVAASIFMGQTEAPLTIRPFLPEATKSEMMTIMTSWAWPARLRRNDGGLHRLRNSGQAPPRGRHHDGARNHSAGQDPRPGDRKTVLTAGRVEIADMERDTNILRR